MVAWLGRSRAWDRVMENFFGVRTIRGRHDNIHTRSIPGQPMGHLTGG
jgi:hypothetical protein